MNGRGQGHKTPERCSSRGGTGLGNRHKEPEGCHRFVHQDRMEFVGWGKMPFNLYIAPVRRTLQFRIRKLQYHSSNSYLAKG